ncbi:MULTISPECIES: hypothetical protein [Microbacterium]|uniref:hypothetical protein n=1 Tax=Microbacterium TaxID=33882 RepID=UPI002782C99D|nr:MULTISPECIES: hypothetical protein [Microbacterium]MDQ1075062.1 hypothetical protein [Microbacterium sp. SORGH_AS_0969]MDQ1115293.1 hypothetical protein [Microbacterium testaceum]
MTLLVVVAITVVVAAGFGIAGAVEQAKLRSIAPVEWMSVGQPTPGGDAATITIRLEDTGRALVENMPRGAEGNDFFGGRKYTCFRVEGDDVYSGPASWEWVSDFAVRLRFGSSSVLIFADKSGYFLPDPDWENPSFRECGYADREWHLSPTAEFRRHR